jgi:hypothetical protein
MDVGDGSSDDDIFHGVGEWNKREVQLANLLLLLCNELGE